MTKQLEKIIQTGWDRRESVDANTQGELRDAVEAIANSYATAPTNWKWQTDTVGGLHWNAVTMSDYNAGADTHDWGRDITTLASTATFDLDIGEIADCVATLEASDPLFPAI